MSWMKSSTSRGGCSLSRKELQRIFERLDRNGDGYVKSEEVSNMILQGMAGILVLSHSHDHESASSDSLITHDDLHSLITNTNTKPTLDFIDFVLFYQTLQLLITTHTNTNTNTIDDDDDDVKKKAFRVFDVNGDGVITPEELETVLTRLGMWNQQQQNNEDNCVDTMNMIKTYDANSDGVLDFQEFNNMLLIHANHHSNSS